MFCSKFYIEGHRIYQLSSLAKSAKSRLNCLSWLGGVFHVLQSRISNKKYLEPLMYALSPYKSLIESFLKKNQGFIYLNNTDRSFTK